MKKISCLAACLCMLIGLAACSKEETPTVVVPPETEQPTIDDVIVEADIKVTPTGGKASEHQPGQDIENSFDGKFGADGQPYHSIWNQQAAFPVTLEYFFDQKPDIDYIIYHTRSGNGNFGEVDVYTATEAAPEYQLQGSYNFRMQNAASRIPFAQTLSKVTKIKFSVKSGLGGFVSCDEMEFYQKNPNKTLDQQLLTVFTDLACTQVKEEATDEAIQALPAYFAPSCATTPTTRGRRSSASSRTSPTATWRSGHRR